MLGNNKAMQGDDYNLGDDATLLGARLVATTPRSETLGSNTNLGNNSLLSEDNVVLGDDATPLGNNTKLITQTL